MLLSKDLYVVMLYKVIVICVTMSAGAVCVSCGSCFFTFWFMLRELFKSLMRFFPSLAFLTSG